MKLPFKVVVQNKGAVTLQKNDYIAAGGEGTVCRRGDVAYKVYHDPKKAVPAAKIRELQALASLPNVLGPREIVFDGAGKKPIGFTMPYVRDTEFLCRLFSKGFRSDHGLGPDEMTYLVKRLQQTLQAIHGHDILVVDLNEMNFLVDSKYSEILFIDVDSYQTPKHRATAIMESIRDRVGQAGLFTEGTDWYSFAVVAFQMYTGYHPYRKGRHPKYKPNDWSARMDEGLSVFHPDVTMSLPWSDWSMIPPAHLDWLRAVLGPSNERSGPPLPDASTIVAVTRPVVVKGTDTFEVTLVADYDSPVLGMWFFGGRPVALTKNGVYIGTSHVRHWQHNLWQGRVTLLPVGDTYEPAVAWHDGGEAHIQDIDGEHIWKIAAEQAMHHDGRLYTALNGMLVETMIIRPAHKDLMASKTVGKFLEGSSQFFPGVVVQDVFGTCWLSVPYAEGKCSNTRVPEMDGYRVVDARYQNGILMAVGERDGRYERFVLFMGDNCSSYRVRLDGDVPEQFVHFAALSNGVCVHQPTDAQIEVFREPGRVKTVDSPPFHTGDRLYTDGASMYFVDGGRLYRISLK